MNPSEAAIVLTFAAAYDRRTVGEADAKAWALALPHVRVKDAQAAIVEYYRESREFLMPSDVGRIVRRQRTDAGRDITPPQPPRELADDPKREVLWSRAWCGAVIDGNDHDRATVIANRMLGITAEPEPLAIESSQMAEIKNDMAKVTADIARTQSLKALERAAKAERFRLAKAERDATPTDGASQ